MSQSHDSRAHKYAQEDLLSCPRLDKLKSEILAVTTRHAGALKRACGDSPTMREDLKDLETAFAELGVSPRVQHVIADNQELRRFLGLILGSRELESNGPYLLKDLDPVLAAHPQAFRALFSSPLLAKTLGAVLASPTLFHEFSQNRDTLPLELMTIKLRNSMPSECFAEWQRCATSSLLWGYQGIRESPSPGVYAKKAQLRHNSFVFDSEQVRDKVVSQIQELVLLKEPIPGILWEVLSPEARREVSLQLPLVDVLGWTNERLGYVARQVQKHHQSCKKFRKHEQKAAKDPEIERPMPHVSAALLQSEFEQYCATMLETCRFLLLYLDDKMQAIGAGPSRQQVVGDGAARDTDSIDSQEVELLERIQKTIGRGLITAMRRLCESMACDSVELRCSEKFAQGVMELLDELHLYLDDEGSSKSGFYKSHLLPVFRRAIERRDFASARAVRLLFPPDAREAPTVKRFLVDDYMQDRRDDILRALNDEASTLSQMLDVLIQRQTTHLPDNFTQRLKSFEGALRHFPLERSIATVDFELMRAVATVIYSLLAWDATVEAKEQRSADYNYTGEIAPSALRTFTGCRRASELLAVLGANSPAQRCVMGAVFSQCDRRAHEALAHFIIHTNFQLVQALQALASTQVTLSDILPECNAAFDAERLYRASPRERRDRLPEVLIRYLPPLLEVGYHILKSQEEFIPPEGLQVIHSSDLHCVRAWQAGIIGDGCDPYRHQLLRRFFDFVLQNGGDVPRHARSIVLESLAHFALEFALRVEKEIDPEEFKRGVSHVLSGFLICSEPLNVHSHLEMARALARIFVSKNARFLSEDDQHRFEIVESFQLLTKEAVAVGLPKAVERFLARPAIRILLQNVGLIQRERYSPLPDAFKSE